MRFFKNREKKSKKNEGNVCNTKRKVKILSVVIYAFFFVLAIVLLTNSIFQYRGIRKHWENIGSKETQSKLQNLFQKDTFFDQFAISLEKGAWIFDSESLKLISAPVACPECLTLISYRNDPLCEGYFFQKKTSSQSLTVAALLAFWEKEGWFSKEKRENLSSKDVQNANCLQFEIEREEKSFSIFLIKESEDVAQLVFFTKKD